MNKKSKKSQQGNQNYNNKKKNQMENLELKNTLSKIKLFLDGLHRTMNMTEGRVSKLEDRLIKGSQPSKERENKL